MTSQQISYIYANEADVLNVALFGMTAKEWAGKGSWQEGKYQGLCFNQ